MDIPAPLFAAWETQHVNAEQSRMRAEAISKRRLEEAKERVARALSLLEAAARLERRAMP